MRSLQTIITNPHDLARLAEALKGSRALALDTEFLRERTYRAQLCLLQIAGTAQAVCIDPLAVDLAPLAPILASPHFP